MIETRSHAADRLCGRGLPGWHRDPVQILSRYHQAAERRCGLGGESLNVVMLVALREMSEHEQPCPGLGRDAAGLPGGQVSPLAGQGGLGVGEGGLAHQHVRAVSELKRGIAAASRLGGWRGELRADPDCPAALG
ncbi:MAG TPA: hypothetical protein VGY58_08540, partial [Gemmataceae bacterium]|nr:hypothetical protein [Gemmataceae bacterium]